MGTMMAKIQGAVQLREGFPQTGLRGSGKTSQMKWHDGEINKQEVAKWQSEEKMFLRTGNNSLYKDLEIERVMSTELKVQASYDVQ